MYWTTLDAVTVWKYALAPPTLLALIAVTRSILDYYLMWNFYYPEEMVSQAGSVLKLDTV
jgi:hypothetical protein